LYLEVDLELTAAATCSNSFGFSNS